MTLDEPHAWHEAPAPGYFGSLLGPARYLPAAAAALTTRTVVEMWCGGRRFRQELTGLRPATPPREWAVPAVGSGTRWEFALDADYFGPGAALTGQRGPLVACAPDCVEAAGPGRVVVRDLRDGGRRAGDFVKI